MSIRSLKSKIRVVPDWPKKGILFQDITPVLQDPKCFKELIDLMAKSVKGRKIDAVVGVDARGFILASALAYKLNTGLVIVRKKGKLPSKTIKKNYTLEYDSNTLEMHADAILKNQRVLIVDDLLATGGTIRATIDLVKKLKGKIVDVIFFIELKDLNGRCKLKGQKITSLIKI